MFYMIIQCIGKHLIIVILLFIKMLLNNIKCLPKLLRRRHSDLRVHIRITVHQNSRQQMLRILFYTSSRDDFDEFDRRMANGKVTEGS